MPWYCPIALLCYYCVHGTAHVLDCDVHAGCCAHACSVGDTSLPTAMTRAYGLGALCGIGAGLALASGLLTALYARGYTWDAGTGIALWFGLFTTALGVVLAAAPWLFVEPSLPVNVDALNVLNTLNVKSVNTTTDNSTQAQPAPVISTGVLDTQVYNSARGTRAYVKYRASTTIEREWIDNTTEFLLWARALNSLASTAHVGKSVRTPNDWQELIAPLEGHGAIAQRQKGVTTVWISEWDATRAMRAVEAGYVQFPEYKCPHVTAYPTAASVVDAFADNTLEAKGA